ncbi:unnamed protein product [Closterium sp. NIES-54]
MAAAKRVLRNLCSTSGLGLVLGGRRPLVLTGHADASWADDQAMQRSSQSYTFSLSSGSELRWLTYLLTDLGEPPRSPPVLYVDNKAMLALCREHRLEHRTKHIALRYFLARELQQRGQLRLAYVASEANTTDIFTKALPPGDHQRFCTMLVMLPPFSSSSPRALNGELLRCANSCGVSLLAARPTSRMPARAGAVSAAGLVSSRVRATVGEGSERGGRSEGRKLTSAEGRRAEGFDAEERRREEGRWGSRTKPQRQGEWRRTEEGGKAGSKGSRQRFVGYADDVAAEDRLRQEAGGAVDWLTRPSNGDAGGHSARSGEWETGKGRGDGPADWESEWDGDGEEQGARGERGGWGEESGGAGMGRARGVQGWMGDGNVERVRRVGADGRPRVEGWEAGWRTVEYGERWRGGDEDGRGSTDGRMGTGMVSGDMSTRSQQQQQHRQQQQRRASKQLPQPSPPQQQLQLQPLSSPSSPLAPIPSPSPLAPVPHREPSPSPASSPRPLPLVLPLPPSALDSLLPFAGSGSQTHPWLALPFLTLAPARTPSVAPSITPISHSLPPSHPHSLPQVVAFMGSPLDWLQRFVLSMGGAVLFYNVNVFATIAAAMYFLWWPLWRAAACNSSLRIRYKYAGDGFRYKHVTESGKRYSMLKGMGQSACTEQLCVRRHPSPARPSAHTVLSSLHSSPPAPTHAYPCFRSFPPFPVVSKHG